MKLSVYSVCFTLLILTGCPLADLNADMARASGANCRTENFTPCVQAGHDPSTCAHVAREMCGSWDESARARGGQ